MNKLTKIFYEFVTWLIALAIMLAGITVPAALSVWAIKWILTMFGVLG